MRLEFKFGIYEGEVDSDDLRHGSGKLTYNNGNKVEGEWVKGALTGPGKKVFANGDKYEGGFKEGKKDGEGKYTFAKGGTYSGGYVDDKQHGEGFWQTDTETYKGNYEGGMRSGHGIEQVQSSESSCTTYEGDWHLSKRHGSGKLTLDNGVYWEGQWLNGEKQEGKLFESNGSEVKDSPQPSTSDIPDLSNLSSQPEMQSLLSALSQQGDNPDMAALQQTLLQTCKGMENFGANITTGLSKAASGLDALESQLEDLTSALGIEDEEIMNEQVAAVTEAAKQQQEAEEPAAVTTTTTAECGTSPIEELEDDGSPLQTAAVSTEPAPPKSLQEQPTSSEEHNAFLERVDVLNDKLLKQVLEAEEELKKIRAA